MRSGCIVLWLLLCTAPTAIAQDPLPRERIRSFEEQLQKVIENAEPSIVSVLVSHSNRYPPLPQNERAIPGRLGRYTQLIQQPRGPAPWIPVQPKVDKLDLSDPLNIPDNLFGSGVVLEAEGYILTAYHLIEGAVKIYVRAANGKGSYADVHAADARSDLAVLKLLDPPSGMKPIRFANVRLAATTNEKPTISRGSWLISLGHPLAAGAADGSPSASWGILSNVRRRAPGPGREDQRSRAIYHYSTLLQTDTRLTLGSSGSALLNLDGELVGISTPLAAVVGTETSGGFAIPIDPNYRRIIETLRLGREVEYGFLGVSVDIALTNRTENGLALGSVIPGTPAYSAGLIGADVPGGPDFITSIDGNPVRDQDDLFLHIGSALAGTKVKLTLTRGGRSRTADVVLAKQDHPLPWIAANRPTPIHGLRVDFSSVLLLQKQNAPRGRTPPAIPPGVVVRDLEPGSPAEARFKAIENAPNQWLITKVNDRAVSTPTEFYREATGKTSVTLQLLDPDDPQRQRELRLP